MIVLNEIKMNQSISKDGSLDAVELMTKMKFKKL